MSPSRWARRAASSSIGRPSGSPRWWSAAPTRMVRSSHDAWLRRGQRPRRLEAAPVVGDGLVVGVGALVGGGAASSASPTATAGVADRHGQAGVAGPLGRAGARRRARGQRARLRGRAARGGGAAGGPGSGAERNRACTNAKPAAGPAPGRRDRPPRPPRGARARSATGRRGRRRAGRRRTRCRTSPPGRARPGVVVERAGRAGTARPAASPLRASGVRWVTSSGLPWVSARITSASSAARPRELGDLVAVEAAQRDRWRTDGERSSSASTVGEVGVEVGLGVTGRDDDQQRGRSAWRTRWRRASRVVDVDQWRSSTTSSRAPTRRRPSQRPTPSRTAPRVERRRRRPAPRRRAARTRRQLRREPGEGVAGLARPPRAPRRRRAARRRRGSPGRTDRRARRRPRSRPRAARDHPRRAPRRPAPTPAGSCRSPARRSRHDARVAGLRPAATARGARRARRPADERRRVGEQLERWRQRAGGPSAGAVVAGGRRRARARRSASRACAAVTRRAIRRCARRRRAARRSGRSSGARTGAPAPPTRDASHRARLPAPAPRSTAWHRGEK